MSVAGKVLNLSETGDLHASSAEHKNNMCSRCELTRINNSWFNQVFLYHCRSVFYARRRFFAQVFSWLKVFHENFFRLVELLIQGFVREWEKLKTGDERMNELHAIVNKQKNLFAVTSASILCVFWSWSNLIWMPMVIHCSCLFTACKIPLCHFGPFFIVQKKVPLNFRPTTYFIIVIASVYRARFTWAS